MQTIARVLLPVLALLLLASSASAQDVPALVEVNVNATWTLPSQSTPVNLTGTWLYQNSGPNLGYVSRNFAVTGELPVSSSQPVPPYFQQFGGSPTPTLILLEGQWRDFQNPANRFFTIIQVPFGPGNALLPGDYPLVASYASDRGLGTDHFQGFSVLATEGSQRVTVAVPELSILRSFTKRLGGHKFNDLLNPTLQRVTAWGAAKLLGAKSSGVYVVLPTKILEVQEWCSGVALIKWLIFLALVLVFVGRIGLPWTAGLVVAAALIGLETNILRVAGIGYGFEHGLIGWNDKDLVGWSTLGLGVGQVALLGLWVNRTNRPAALRRNS